MTDETVTAAEAARRSGISRRTLVRWIDAGKLPATPGEHGYRINLADLQAVLDAQRKPTVTKAKPTADSADVIRLRAELQAATERAERAELRELAAQMRADELLRTVDRLSRSLLAATPTVTTDPRPDVATVERRGDAGPAPVVVEPAPAAPVRRRWWRRT